MVQCVVDLLVRIKNFSISKKVIFFVKKQVKFSSILYSLYKNGLIQSFGTVGKMYSINLRFFYNKPIITYLKFFSKPSVLIYLSLIDIYKLPTKKFLFFFSTSRGGIFTQLDCKKQKTGGKLLFVL